ncbi:hypothetical protein psal_cds_1082 [Pandoravirus salinus]|uniref:DUF5848 domain-containing protein n=1 Tax=Pandoravirus salinus TaxID=1349410 RepID=S4VY49_9VIRU|nr:hypothetical protein psal_cds_1082 [Pandoravirus salinus]AGO85298.1 hypothetical protein psal_cds_1082 [Pandoravirus salinus]
MSRAKRARIEMDDEMRPEPVAVDLFSPSALIDRLRAACSGAGNQDAFLQILARGAYIAAGDPVTLCASLVAIYEPLWRGLTPIHATFPVLYRLLGRPPTPASIAEAVAVLAPDLVADAAVDPLSAVWRMAAAVDARRWATVPSDEWRSRVGPNAFEGAYENRTAMARYETQRPTMADLVRSTSLYPDDGDRHRYFLAATRDARGNDPVVAVLMADGAVLASMGCRRPPDARGAIDCAMDLVRNNEAIPADITPYMRTLLTDDQAVGSLLRQMAVPAAFGGLYGLGGALLRDLWDIAPVARPALLAASRPGARWLVAELDEHQLTAEIETERNIEHATSRLAPLLGTTPTLVTRSARTLSQGPASATLLADLRAPQEVKALVAAQRVTKMCGRVLTPDDMPHLVDAADALGVPGEVTLELLGPYGLCSHAAEAAAPVLERYHGGTPTE